MNMTIIPRTPAYSGQARYKVDLWKLYKMVRDAAGDQPDANRKAAQAVERQVMIDDYLEKLGNETYKS